MTATEYRVWCVNGDLIGYYRANGSEVEDYSTGRYMETHYLGHPDTADQWASRMADTLLEKTIRKADEDQKDDFSLQVCESGDE